MLISTAALAERLDDPDLAVIDATYVAVQGDPPRDERAEFAAGHVPHARFLDLGALSRAQATSLPTAAAFADRLAAIGVSPDHKVVLYDDSPHHTAARAWWLFRLLAPAAPVMLLDGGIARWRAEGRPVETGEATETSHVAAAGRTDDAPPPAARTRDDMLAALRMGAQVVDARSPARFDGTEPDPRGLPGGHMPGARNLHYARFFRDDGTWRSPDELARLFAGAGIDTGREVIATCGSGITAAVPAFALALLGGEPALYDGSWSEWAADPATPKAVG